MFRRKVIPVWVGIILLSGMFLMGQGNECPWTEVVSFPDEGLESTIRGKIGKPSGPICPSDLEGITVLYADGRWIKDLNGLEYCTGLTNLYISGNQISGLTPLAGLTALGSLYLSDNQISDIGPLAGLTNLEWLGLSVNQISDISPLAGLTSLWGLYLSGNQIGNISPVARLTGLLYLHLSDNHISDISPLVGLTGLHYLYLSDNQISDIGALAGLTDPEGLYLSGNQISDIGALAGLTGLWELDLSDNQVSDIGALTEMTGLVGLYLSGNQISDISPLTGMTGLVTLELSENQISDINPLAGMTNLSLLRLAGNQISDIYPLVQNSWIGDGDEVYLANNPLSCTSCNVYIPDLQSRGVYVSHNCPCEDAVSFPDPNLEQAIREAIRKPVGDICASDLINLASFYASNASISDLTGLEHCTGLRWLLDLSDNQISDIYPLVQNCGIGSGLWVSLINNPLNETSCTVYIPELQSRGVYVDDNCL